MSVDTAAQSVSLDWLLDSMQERKWARSSSTWSLRDSHISTRGVSLFSSIVSFPNGSLGRSFAQVGAAKPTTIAQTVTNIATCIFSTPRSAHRRPLQTGRQIVQRAEPCVFSIHLGETHDGDLRDFSKERWQDSWDVFAPISYRPNSRDSRSPNDVSVHPICAS